MLSVASVPPTRRANDLRSPQSAADAGRESPCTQGRGAERPGLGRRGRGRPKRAEEGRGPRAPPSPEHMPAGPGAAAANGGGAGHDVRGAVEKARSLARRPSCRRAARRHRGGRRLRLRCHRRRFCYRRRFCSAVLLLCSPAVRRGRPPPAVPRQQPPGPAGRAALRREGGRRVPVPSGAHPTLPPSPWLFLFPMSSSRLGEERGKEQTLPLSCCRCQPSGL